MAAHSEAIDILVDEEHIAGTFLTPPPRMPGVLFVHGWGGSQQRDLERARGIAGLGCVCLSFDLRGHGQTFAQQQTVTREQNLNDVLAAYDMLAAHPHIDPAAIAVVGTSYGGYLAALLTGLRPVKWLALRVPALYRDEDWAVPKRQLDRAVLNELRTSRVLPTENRALAACARFEGDVLLVESEKDHLVPHQTIMNYRAAFQKTHSLTHRIIFGADHALSHERCQEAYTSILVNWTTEMVIGARLHERSAGGFRPVGEPPPD
ncbi:alpha/beta hydrolase family protein [Stutzerimonas balearica]|jgi:pimeloyl-ACP methyl ester carboxylesterase|uniref:Permease n=2 Tax=Stutzerimonas balearica TaxID=74829 RepID=A0A8D3XZ82_9GAMM|nr:alpha/beta fold hydrolase [Stutzerimonas balearica]HAV89012.1 alpha/beta hydrolase [Pseudomonas sp.]AJE14469.1 permease [Stutzerimonas balearica DSM 6083]MBC7201330.1 alpha/beta fold hydrolase [Stutzerimonas balearica]MBK3747300.1 alpha/beta fold hydrolase [Stutzerimonas balearica]MBK3825497.1 alpha/beta fold hydrolase [Stutzerimonas balearica]